MEIFIKGTNSISPAGNFGNITHVPEIKFIDGLLKYYSCVEPVYKEIINPVLLRRMSRTMKISIVSAMLCLKDAGVEIPDAIIAGTGMGCVEDSDKFLSLLIENEERMLNPTPFIYSTHNTISSQIAIMLKCHGYNSTYAGRGACFETSILDALMLLSDGNASNVLVGAYDELIANQIRILYRMCLFRDTKESNSNEISGNHPGEGAAFFVLSAKPSGKDYAKISGMSVFSENEPLSESITGFLKKHFISFENINSVMFGNLHNNIQSGFYKKIVTLFPAFTNLLWFKHLCGEYMTSSAFALWLGANCLKTQQIPEIAFLRKTNNLPAKNMLIINNLSGNQFAIFLLTK